MQENLSPQAAEKLINAHDGDVALLYVWQLYTGSTDTEAAAGALCRTLREIDAAREKLLRMGLWADGTTPVPAQSPVKAAPAVSPAQAVQPPEPAEELPQYLAADIANRDREDPVFQALRREADSVTGRKLSTADLGKLLGIYDYLALPGEVVMTLLHYCAEEYARRYGEGRRPGMRYIEKEAFIWVRNGILNIESAEEYIAGRAARATKRGALKEAIGIRGRELTSSEARYLDSWVDMGFSPEAVAIAYDRTVTNTGKLSWNYLNKILESWKAKGLYDPAEIEAKDGRRPAQQGSAGSAVVSESAIRGIMDDSIIDKI